MYYCEFKIVAQKGKLDEETNLVISRSSLKGLARVWYYTHTTTEFQKSSWFKFSRAVRRHFQPDNKHPTERSNNRNNRSKYSKNVFASDLNSIANSVEELRNCKQSSETYGTRVYDLIEMVNVNKTKCEMAVNLIN